MRRRPDLLLWITFAVHAAGLLPARTGSAQSDLPRTVAETSQYQATARHADVLQFVDALDQRADHVRRLDFGASVEGRPLIAAVAAQPPVEGPGLPAGDPRLVAVLVGGIHAGECDGKEALLKMLREVAADPQHRWLQDFVLVFVPNLNVDGGERLGSEHRPGQPGPAVTGRRENAQQLDLNRDFVKLETPEIRGLVQLVQHWDAAVIIDTHTTNGSHHRYALTYDIPHHPAAPETLRGLLRDDVLPRVTARLATQSIDTFYYGNFNPEHTRWTTYGYQPRYGAEYFGLSGRLAILSESYAYRPYAERIQASAAFVAACLDELADRREEVRTRIEAFRHRQLELSRQTPADERIPIRAALAPLDQQVTILGTAAGGTEPQDYQVEFYGRAESRLDVQRPYAYLVPQQLSRVVERLRWHGLRVEQLQQERILTVGRCRATKVRREGSSFQFHRLVDCEVERHSESWTAPAGTYVVRLDQPLAVLAVNLLEPDADDGFLTWNFFDADVWEQGDAYPVKRLLMAENLPLQTVEQVPAAQRLDLDQIYGPKRRVNFGSPFPFGIRWLPASNDYLRQVDNRWQRISAETGAHADFYDAAAVARTLETLGEITAEDARRMAGDLGTLSPDATAIVMSHGHDLYYARLDGSQARRLTHDPARERLATFSPDGKLVAFVRDNNLHVVDVATSRQWALTTEGNDQRLMGILDWVYQEEVYGRGDFQGYWWSPDSRHIALLSLDETPVHRYTVTDHMPFRQSLEVTPYPKAGDPLPRVRLGMVAVAGGDVTWIEDYPDTAADHLIVRVAWNPSGDNLYYQVQNREQTWLELRRATVAGRSSRVLRDDSPAWIDPHASPMWLNDGSFLWLSPRSGHTHVYQVAADGSSIKAVTSGEWEVRTLHGSDQENRWVFFQAAIEHAAREQTYRVPLEGGSPQRLSDGAGSHSARFNDQFTYYFDSFSQIHAPPAMQICRADGTPSYALAPYVDDQLKYYRLQLPEYHQVPARDGYPLDAWLIKPPDFDPQKKYPVLCYVYGGPQAPVVRDRWSGNTYLWHQLLAQTGICVWICDNRASSLHGIGTTWKVHRRLGEQELQDVEDGLDWLARQGWMDPDRVALWGWSYGGYLTSYALTHSQRFCAGISGAPVTDWRNYDAIYTERLMGLPQNNAEGYERSSVVAAAEKLHGRLLLIHGEVDDNVHLANSLQLARALQRAGRHFELMIYPQNQHSVTQPEQSRHLQELMTRFLLDALRPEGHIRGLPDTRR
jgi:dipeptidyl-peptidase 4